MFFFGRRKQERDKKSAETEAEIKRLQHDTLEKINQAAEQTRKVNQLIDNNPGGIVELLYYAMGNNRREK